MNRKQWRAWVVSNRRAEVIKLMLEKAACITDLQVCDCFEEFEHGFLPCGSLFHLEPDFVRTAFMRALDRGLLISVQLERRNGHGEFDQAISGFILTDAGKHLVMTSVTGKSARDTLNEIEEEMAGQA
ncbi:MAG: hypothetical protein Q7J45_00810 [bacterium]|nr:hypothetical protein [bacterium]